MSIVLVAVKTRFHLRGADHLHGALATELYMTNIDLPLCQNTSQIISDYGQL